MSTLIEEIIRIRDECKAASVDLIPASDPEGHARDAFKTFEDALTEVVDKHAENIKPRNTGTKIAAHIVGCVQVGPDDFQRKVVTYIFDSSQSIDEILSVTGQTDISSLNLSNALECQSKED